MKRAWKDVGTPVTVNVFLVDIDTPAHGPWGEAFVTSIVSLFDTQPTLARAGLYFTKHGCRIAQGTQTIPGLPLPVAHLRISRNVIAEIGRS